MSDRVICSDDRFFDKFHYHYKAEYDQDNMSLDYKEYDKDGNQTFSVIHRNIDVYSEDDIERLEYIKKYPGNYKYHLCSTYALQKVLDMSFEDAYMLQSRYGMKYKVIMNCGPCIDELLKDKGYTQDGDLIKESKFKDVNMRTILSAFKEGRYYLTLKSDNPKYTEGSHAVAYINGELYSHSFERISTKSSIRRESRLLLMDTLWLLNDFYLQAYMYKLD